MTQSQSAVPPPIFMPRQSAAPTATPSPLPHRGPATASSSSTSQPHNKKAPVFRTPKLRLEIRDACSPGARALLGAVNAGTALEDAVQGVLHALYTVAAAATPTQGPPGTRSVTLILRSMPGVAYTTGIDLDPDHKEIHLSTDYIDNIAASRTRDEILGILWHEMVHCFQWNAGGTAPGGLIEGIADWVRLKAGYAPPHWSRSADGDWDAGYQHTGYFLAYLEDRFGQGTVRRVNEALRGGKYDGEKFWVGLVGVEVERLWKDYGEWLKKREDDEELVVVEREESDAKDAGEKTVGKDGHQGQSGNNDAVKDQSQL